MDAINDGDVASARWQAWHTIPWAQAHQHVRRLQTRIAKAAKAEDWRRVSCLQRLLVRSTTAKAVAVRRVTENQGRKTPGVDGITWSTPTEKRRAMDALESRVYRPKPLRRIHIPKTNGGKRPLGIPTMRDRAMQALYWLGLDPVAETRGDLNSYGFRSGRSTADAIAQCHNALSRAHSPQWVLEGDIKGCFDNISHDWLLRNVPMDRHVLSKWLKAGFMQGRKLFPTDAGTPQGGIISPCLANLALDGMERLLDRLPRRAFLGWNVRKFKNFLRIVPSEKNAAAFYDKVRDRLRDLRGARQEDVVFALNPVIRGWGNYHRIVHASRPFAKMDHLIFRALWRWALRRHPTKGRRWVKRRHFSREGSRDWLFQANSYRLVHLSTIPIGKYVKVRSDANPYDPKDESYFDERLTRRMKASLMGRRKLYWLWTKQEGRCPECGMKITKATGWHVHHRVWRVFGGSDKLSNLQLLHPTCHVQLHARDARG